MIAQIVWLTEEERLLKKINKKSARLALKKGHTNIQSEEYQQGLWVG